MIYQRYIYIYICCCETFNLTYTKKYNLMVQRVKRRRKIPLELNLVIASFILIPTLGRALTPELFFLSSFLITNIINDMNNKKKGLPINNHTIIIIIIIIFMGIILLLINSS